MARGSTRIDLDTRVLDAMIKNMGGNVADAVETIAFSVEADAKVNIQQMDAIDTGALLNSGYTSIKGGNRQSKAYAEARARRPGVVLNALPTPRDDHTAYVGFPVEYAQEVHNGGVHHAARPFLLKAVRDNERKFKEQLGMAVTKK